MFYAGRTLAEYYGKKYYHIFYTPQVLRSDNYSPAGNKRPFRNRLQNKILWYKSITENNYILKSLVNDNRENLGLDKINDVYTYFIDHPGSIIATDENLARIPSHYSTYIKQINFLNYEDREVLADPLLSFLKNGNKPILINFGSAELTTKNFKELLSKTIETVDRLGYRAIVISNTKIKEYTHNENVFFCEYVSHASLLPWIELIIHHGGAGTVYNSLKNGVPQIIIPQILDQHFWAEIVKNNSFGEVIYNTKGKFLPSLENALSNVLGNRNIKTNASIISNWLNSEQYQADSAAKIKAALSECFCDQH